MENRPSLDQRIANAQRQIASRSDKERENVGLQGTDEFRERTLLAAKVSDPMGKREVASANGVGGDRSK